MSDKVIFCQADVDTDGDHWPRLNFTGLQKNHFDCDDHDNDFANDCNTGGDDGFEAEAKLICNFQCWFANSSSE